MSEKKSFFWALKFFVSDIGSAFSDLFKALPFVASRRRRLDEIISKINRLGERLERIEENLGAKKEKNLSVFCENLASSDQLFARLSTYPDNPRSDEEILQDMAPKSEVARAIQQKLDEVEASFPKWIDELCVLLHSDQLSVQQKNDLEKAIKLVLLLRTDVSVQFSKDWLMKMIHQKYTYAPPKNFVRSFQEDLIECMGSDYPLVLRKIP
jgi:hypothetical protein